MTLNRWDDLPFHQTVASLGTPATSDSHFNDGYYFAFYEPGRHVFCGLRVHPNNNVLDGYAGVVTGGSQRSQRFSRALLPDHDQMVVGPLSVEIVEPMERQRIVLGSTDIGLSFDVEVTAAGPPFVETDHQQHRFGRVINDLVRYTQVGRAEGTYELDGVDHVVAGMHAARDHSWGIRSTMGPYVPIGGTPGTDRLPDRRAIRLWIPFDVDDHAGFFHTHEDLDGRTLDFGGRLDFRDGRTVDLVSVTHQLRYHDGSRRLAGGVFTLTDTGGATYEYEFESVCDPAHPQGFGYTRGWSDGGQPGVYRGEYVTESETFEVSDPGAVSGPDHVPVERRLGGTEFVSSLSGPDGAAGMAHVEHMIYGPYRPYGFT